MSKIGTKGTGPETAVRRLLRSHGFQFRSNPGNLPGKPDIAFLSKRAAIFVHGCFWHKHNCRKGKSTPKSNAAFWAEKRSATVARDGAKVRVLRRLGWRTLVVWECQVNKGKPAQLRLIKFLSKRK